MWTTGRGSTPSTSETRRTTLHTPRLSRSGEPAPALTCPGHRRFRAGSRAAPRSAPRARPARLFSAPAASRPWFPCRPLPRQRGPARSCVSSVPVGLRTLRDHDPQGDVDDLADTEDPNRTNATRTIVRDTPKRSARAAQTPAITLPLRGLTSGCVMPVSYPSVDTAHAHVGTASPACPPSVGFRTALERLAQLADNGD